MTTTTAIIEAIAKCAEALSWYFRYKIFGAGPKRRENLLKECEDLENEIKAYRKKIGETDSMVCVNFYNDVCDELRVKLARRRRELEYLSNLDSADSVKHGD